MRKRQALVFWICGILPMVAFAAETSEQIITVEVEGEVPYIDGGLLATKEQALAAAQRKALEEALGLYVSGQTVVEKARLIDDKIFSRTAGYLKKWTIISERRNGDFYLMKIKADVKLGDVKKDLDTIGLLLQQTKVSNPRVLIKIDGIIDGQKSEVDTAFIENRISSVLMEKGFRLVDRDQLNELHQLSDMSPAELAKYGKQLDAELILVGKVKAINNAKAFDDALNPYMKPTKFSNPFKSYRAEIVLRAIKTSTGEVILTDQERPDLPGKPDVTEEGALNNAIEKALTLTMRKVDGKEEFFTSLLVRLPGRLAESLSQGDNAFVVKVSGVGGMEGVKMFLECVRTIEGVVTCQLRTLEMDMAQFDLSHKYANAQILAARMEKVPNIKIKVTGVTGQSVEVEIQGGLK